MYSRGPLVRFKVCLLYHISGSFQDQLLDWGLQSFLGYWKFKNMGLILAIDIIIYIIIIIIIILLVPSKVYF